MEIRHNITFNLRTYGKNRDKYQIRMRVTFGGWQLDVASGSFISDKSVWNAGLEKVNDDYRGIKGQTGIAINNNLDNARRQMETAFKFFEANDVFPDDKQLLEKYKERMTGIIPKKPVKKTEEKEAEVAFYDVFDKFTESEGKKNAWTKASYEKFSALRNDLKTFKKRIRFDDIDEKWLTDFVCYLRDEKILHTPHARKGEDGKRDRADEVGLYNSSIEKKLGFLRWFLNWATDNGYNTKMAFRTFKPKLKKAQKKIIYLTKDELLALKALEFSPEQKHLEQTRDCFLFMCFSSLRWSDIHALTKDDIKGDHIEFTTRKTADSLSIELNQVTSAILDKYKDVPLPGNKALPVPVNQRMNLYVKEICKMAGIDEPVHITRYRGGDRIDEIYPKYELVGTHTGRRTFVTQSLSLGIPADVVMKWTGHSDYKAMKPYIDIVDSIKAQSMAKFNDFL